MKSLFTQLKKWFKSDSFKNNAPQKTPYPRAHLVLESLEVRTLLAANALNDAPNVEFQITEDWNSGHTAELVLTNDESSSYANWQFEFDYDRPITELWNAQVEPLSGGHYRLTPPEWDNTLDPGEQLAVGFVAGGSGSVPANFSFNGESVPGGGNPPGNNASSEPGYGNVNDLSPSIAAPNTPTVSVQGDPVSGGYRVTFNLWSGTAAESWKLFEDGEVIHEVILTGPGTTPQSDSLLITDRTYGVYTYQAEVSNASGSTVSDEIVYVAGDASTIEITGVDQQSQALLMTIDQGTSEYTLSLRDNELVQFQVATNNPRVVDVDIVGDQTLRVTGVEAGRGSLRLSDALSGAIRYVGIRVRTADGELPGLPDYLSIGSVSEDTPGDLAFWQDFDGSNPLTNKFVDSRYIYLNGGPVNGWRSWGNRVSSYLQESLKLGMIPQFVYYNIPDGGESYVTNNEHIQSTEYMEAYFRDLQFALQTIASEAGDELVQFILEPDFIGYLMQNANASASSLPAMTSAAYSSGVLETGVDPQFDNTVTGLVQAINYTIGRYAPNVEFGWQFNLWASRGIETPIPANGIVHLTDTMGIEAGRAAIAREAELIAEYYIDAGVLSYGADFISIDKYGLDGAAQNGAAADPAASTWFWNSDHWHNYLLTVKALSQTTDRDMILWQMPVGHINDSLAANPYDAVGTFDPLENTTRKYEDSAPTFFLGDSFTATDNRFDYFATNEFGDEKLTVSGSTITWGSHMEEARAAGVRQILFGAGVGISTDSIGSDPTDDYWWITQVQQYYQNPVAMDGSTIEPPPTSDPPVDPPPTIAVSVASVIEGNPTAVAGGYLQASGNQIVDSAGNPVRISGVNWFGGETPNFAPHGLWTRNWQEMMDQMVELGFNTIRLPFSQELFEPGSTPNGVDTYQNPDLEGLSGLEIMDKIVDYAGEKNLRIILDHHRSDAGAGPNGSGLWYDDNYSEADWVANWEMLAERYAGNPTVIGADLHNEPHGPATWGSGDPLTDWRMAAEKAGNAVLAKNPSLLILVEGIESTAAGNYWWGGNLSKAGEFPVELNVPNRLVYSPHAYPASVYQQDWFTDPSFPNNQPEIWTNMWGYLYQDGIAPLMLGEFGSLFENPLDEPWMDKMVEYLSGDLDGDGSSELVGDQQGISWTWWSWNPNSGDTGGVLENDWRTPRSEVIEKLQPVTFELLPTSGEDETTGTANLSFQVVLSAAANETVSVDYRTEAGTTTAGEDFIPTSGTLEFTPGETSKVVLVQVIPDLVVEDDETVTLLLTNPTGAEVANPVNVGTILNDDWLSSGVEGDYSENGTVDAADYIIWRDTLGSFADLRADGDGSGVVDRADYDYWRERFGNSSNQNNPGQVPPPDGPVDPVEAPTILISGATVAEGDSGFTLATFTVTLSEPAREPVTVNFQTSSGTATAGQDYEAASGQIAFTVGEVEQTVDVRVFGDTTVEPDETFEVVLSDPVGAVLAGGDTSSPGAGNDPNSTPPNTDSEAQVQQTVMAAYYPEWGIYGRNYQIADVPADQLTHLIYAFVDLNAEGKIELFDSWAAVERLFTAEESVDGTADGLYAGDPELVNGVWGNFRQIADLKALHPHLRVSIAVGGWTLSKNFSSVLSTAAGRETASDSVIEFLRSYTMFDGVDFDWEYPGGGGLGGNSESPQDGANYAAFLGLLREKLDVLGSETGRYYEISVASPAGSDKIARFNLPELKEHVDFFNLMTYDFHGTWENTTGHLAAFQNDPAGYDIKTAMDLYLAADVPRENIVLGAPLYTRAWSGVANGGDGGYNESSTDAAPGSFWDSRGVYDYKDLLRQIQSDTGGWELNWDDDAQAAYLYSESQGIFSSFETPGTIALKSEWAQSMGLGGMMFWDLSNDTTGEESLITAAAQSWFAGKTFDEIVAASDLVFENIYGGNGLFDPIAEAATPPSDPTQDNGGGPGGGSTGNELLASAPGTILNDDNVANPSDGPTDPVDPDPVDPDPVDPPVTTVPGVTLSFAVTDSWDDGFTAAVTVANTGTMNISGWTVQFDLGAEILNIWNAEIVSHTGSRYVIRNASWNVDIAVGAETSFGFQAAGDVNASPLNIVLNGDSIEGLKKSRPE